MNTRKPRGYWTKEKCHEKALKFNSKIAFKYGEPSAYNIAHSKKWLNDICSHMKLSRMPNGYWTKARCRRFASLYKSRIDFHNNSSSAYGIACKNGWIDEICSHMQEKKLPNGYWTKERCREEALKYDSRSDFMKGSPSAFNLSSKHGWKNEICAHMKKGKKPNGYWTKENIHREALKYTSMKDFIKNSGSAHTIACRNGWLEEICSHIYK